MSRSCRLLLLAPLALVACAPAGGPPVQVMALVPDTQGRLVPTRSTLTSLVDPVALTGTVATFTGGAVVQVDPGDPLQADLAALDDQHRFEAVVKNRGVAVSAEYLEREGVLWPTDFHSWAMVTTYRNLERAYAYFLEAADGADVPELRGVRVLYWAEVHLGAGAPALTDNALYVSLLKSFAVAPQQDFQLVPMSMNLGVMAHEYAHRAFNERVFAGEGLPAALAWTGSPFNLLRSLDEGLADFHGHGATCLEPSGCQPDFLAPSVPDAATVAARDLSRPDACMTASLRSAFLSAQPSAWNGSAQMYQVGTLWAAALSQAAAPRGALAALQKAVLHAYDDATGSGLRQLVAGSLTASQGFTPEAVAEVLLSHVTDPSLQRDLCSQLLTRLQLTCTTPTSGGGKCVELPHCPATAVRDASTCPTLGAP